jgi:tetratricopeptide (TPR) repeat protein
VVEAVSKEERDAAENLMAQLKRARDAADYQTARTELDAALAMLDNVAPQHRSDLQAIIWIDYEVIADHFGDHATSVVYSQKLLADEPDDLGSHLSLLRAYQHLGKREEALESLRRSGELAEQSNDTAVLAMLATAGYLPAAEPARAKRIEDAISSYREMLETERPFPASRRHAMIQYGLGRLYGYRAQGQTGPERVRSLQDAVVAYRSALQGYSAERFPDYHRALMRWLGDAEGQLGAATSEQ